MPVPHAAFVGWSNPHGPKELVTLLVIFNGCGTPQIVGRLKQPVSHPLRLTRRRPQPRRTLDIALRIDPLQTHTHNDLGDLEPVAGGIYRSLDGGTNVRGVIGHDVTRFSMSARTHSGSTRRGHTRAR